MLNTKNILKHTHSEDFNDFESFFHSSPDLLCVAGYDGYFKKINSSVSKLLEYTEEELLSKPINDFVFESDKQKTASSRFDLTKKIGLFNFENRYLTKSGKIVWLYWTSHPMDDKKLIYAIAKNITSKKEVELERKQYIRLLTQSNEYLKKLTYTTVHDLRSPINNLISVFQLIDLSKISDNENLELLTILEEITTNLKSSLNDTIQGLDNKFNENNLLEIVDFKSISTDVINSIHSLVQNSQAKITVDFEKLPSIEFNKAALKSIFLNLITNSIKYSIQNTIPEISITTQQVNNKKQLIIQDNGIGFDMLFVKDKVFGLHQKFNSQKDSTGIGLYLVHSHVTNFGGKITLESEPNKGAKFIITFK